MSIKYNVSQFKVRISAGLLGASMLSFGVANPAFAANNYTPAGTNIVNTATATYDNPAGGTPLTATSNTVTMKVDELLDVTTTSTNTGPIIVNPGDPAKVTTFEVTNTGNGPEVFNLTAIAGTAAGTGTFPPSSVTVYLDTNGNGAYDPGVDQPASATPSLNPDDKVTVFVVSSIPADATDGQEGKVELTATAVTGSGSPGTVFNGQGAGGGNAVVGSTTATSTDDATYKISAATVTLVKSQVIVDPWGGSTTVPGSTITYTIVANVAGSGTLMGLKLTDVVPTGTTYQAGTITFESAIQTDAVDSDPGSISSNTVLATVPDVVLGSTSTTATRTLTFKVKVN